MKKLPLQNPRYLQHIESFKQWLSRIGMSPSAIYNMPIKIRELLHFMECRGIDQINKIGIQDIRDYFAYLQIRPNQKRGGGISTAHYNKQLQAVKKFSTYVWHHYKILLPVRIKRAVGEDRKPVVLSTQQIELLYDTSDYHRYLSLRDKVILDVFYSCGLRRNEGVHLCCEDIYLDKRILYVSKGKNYTQRYVPFTQQVALRFKEYLEYDREMMLREPKEKRFFITAFGKAMGGQGLISRIKVLQQRSENKVLQGMKIGLHTLRHSIATHLLYKGMPLRQIAKFLGHKSIEATQIYTHLVHEMGQQL